MATSMEDGDQLVSSGDAFTDNVYQPELEEQPSTEGTPLVPYGPPPPRPPRIFAYESLDSEKLPSGHRKGEETNNGMSTNEHVGLRDEDSDTERDNPCRASDVAAIIIDPSRRNDNPAELPTPVASHGLPQQINMNHYATKKTVATGLLDVCLLMANAALLKSVLQQGDNYEFFGFLISMLIFAILTEIATGVLLLLIGRDDLNNIYKQRKIDWLNNIATACVFAVTTLNIFIAAFGLKNTTLAENTT
ncbi:ninjurin-1-like [Saccoglossus kowalevskii]